MKNNKEITINDLLAELMKSGKGNIYPHEYLVIYPIGNQAQILERGIINEINAKNYVCAVSLLRSLIESAMTLVYDASTKKEEVDEYYKQFIKFGRICRKNKKNKWVKLTGSDLIKQFEKITKLKIMNIYNTTCDVLHFSSAHVRMLTSKSKKNNKSLEIIFGNTGPKISDKEYQNIKQITDDLISIIKQYIAAGIHRKRIDHKEPVSKIANAISDIKKVK